MSLSLEQSLLFPKYCNNNLDGLECASWRTAYVIEYSKTFYWHKKVWVEVLRTFSIWVCKQRVLFNVTPRMFSFVLTVDFL